VRLRGFAPLLSAVLVACGGSDRPGEDGSVPQNSPAAAVVDRPVEGQPRPGWYEGRTTQGRGARLEVFPGGRVDFLINARLECDDGSDPWVRVYPNRIPVLRRAGAFSHRETGRTPTLEYTNKAAGKVGHDRAGGAYSGKARYRDGRECDVRLAWSTARLPSSGD
jgi:hypothetical protein